MPLYLWRRLGPDGKRAGPFYLRGRAYRGGPSINESTGLTDRALARLRLKERERELVERGSLPAHQWVTFAEAMVAFIELHPPEKPGERRRLLRLLDAFEGVLVSTIGQAQIDEACRRVLRPGVAPATRLREVITPMTSVLRFASRRGWCQAPDFERPRQAPGRTRWLTPAEFSALHASAAPHLQPLLTFLACTGARLSEALELEWSAVDLGRARAVFHVTKSTRPRVTDLPPLAVATLAALPHREGRVFLHPHRWRQGVMEPYRDTGRDGGGQIRTGFNAAVRRAGVARCTPHDLRHTWGSWHYHLHRDPMKLQHEGGWQSLAMVSRYAHLAMGDFADGIRAAWGLPAPASAVHERWGEAHERRVSGLAGRFPAAANVLGKGEVRSSILRGSTIAPGGDGGMGGSARRGHAGRRRCLIHPALRRSPRRSRPCRCCS